MFSILNWKIKDYQCVSVALQTVGKFIMSGFLLGVIYGFKAYKVFAKKQQSNLYLVPSSLSVRVLVQFIAQKL